MLTTTLLEQINKVFPLQVDETLKLQLLTTQGQHIIAAGVSVWWQSKAGTVYRTTNQLGVTGLTLIPDNSDAYLDLMLELNDMELAHLPDKLTSALYFYTYSDRLTFHCFTRK